ncbi:MAE_28990/MAE_18760 family HEPN-like nuclease [Clostridium perfringens]|uniref:MAE_28990/MAE_18760 family HEPN-like nuclease n=1 Tax=Clostridium perfringens TaxID=1502 RepID=UPI001ABA6AA8|nr:MAE_28990/MAE_18760 family HEPN-like nuclease [Clostridium perfringens]MBO3336008.1 hypothetical protein [Clostridium perfringens]
MNTFAYDFFESMHDRWQEIDLLIQKAKDEENNEDLYNVLCRAAVVLSVANLEGFIKETVKVILNDINKFSKFCDAPEKLKITFCNSFLDVENNYKQVNKLIKLFDELETKFTVEPFLFENNKNPSPTIIDKICNKFGINNFFGIIEESKVNIVFENDNEQTKALIERLYKSLLNGCENYPYKVDLTEYELNLNAKKSSKKGLWKDFLDELLRKRHAIAHGTTFDNEVSISEMLIMKQKIQVLQYIFAIILINFSIKNDQI